MTASRRTFLQTALGGLALAGGHPLTARQPTHHPIGDADVGPAEDLMREHGVLNRILLIYEEGQRRIRGGEAFDGAPLREAAGLIQRFLEGYHERLEEEHLFPRFERARRLTDLVDTLRTQHRKGRELTARLLELTAPAAFGLAERRKEADDVMARFIRMYRPHEAREDTILFPALRELVTKAEYRRLGDRFEAQEAKALGEKGFERVVATVEDLERALGIHDLARFTEGA